MPLVPAPVVDKGFGGGSVLAGMALAPAAVPGLDSANRQNSFHQLTISTHETCMRIFINHNYKLTSD